MFCKTYDGLQYLGQNSRIRTALIQLVILFSVLLP